MVIAIAACSGRKHEPPPGPGSAAPTAKKQPRPAKWVDPRTRPPGSIAGTVRTDAGTPIANARVCADPVRAYDLPIELRRDPICTASDARGAYAIANVIPASYRPLAMAATLWPVAARPVAIADGAHVTDVDLVMHAGGVRLTGTIEDLAGHPIAHARVRAARLEDDDGEYASEHPRDATTETDEHGTYELWTAPGRQWILVAATGYADIEQRVKAPGTADAQLPPDSTVTGTVVDASGTAVPDARVWLGSPDGESSRPDDTITDAAGTFRLSRMLPGCYVVHARDTRGTGTTEGHLDIGLGDRVDGVTVALKPAARVTARVLLGAASCPDAGARIVDENHLLAYWAYPDGDGLAIDGVPAGTYWVEAWCPGFATEVRPPAVKVEASDVSGLGWPVAPGKELHGRVVTRRGEAVARVQVTAEGHDGSGSSLASHHVTTDAKGGFTLRGLPSMNYTVSLWTDRGLSRSDDYPVAEKSLGAATHAFILDEGGTIEGDIVDAAGTPVGGAAIDPRTPEQDAVNMSGGNEPVSASGTFTISNLRPGPYILHAHRGDLRHDLEEPGAPLMTPVGKHVTVRPGQTTRVHFVVVAPSDAIRGTVVDAKGAPVAGALVFWDRDLDASATANPSIVHHLWSWTDRPLVTGADGTFAVTGLSATKYTLAAYRAGGLQDFADHVRPGTTIHLVVRPVRSGAK